VCCKGWEKGKVVIVCMRKKDGEAVHVILVDDIGEPSARVFMHRAGIRYTCLLTYETMSRSPTSVSFVYKGFVM
jgi:hypothetical protein